MMILMKTATVQSFVVSRKVVLWFSLCLVALVIVQHISSYQSMPVWQAWYHSEWFGLVTLLQGVLFWWSWSWCSEGIRALQQKDKTQRDINRLWWFHLEAAALYISLSCAILFLFTLN